MRARTIAVPVALMSVLVLDAACLETVGVISGPCPCAADRLCIDSVCRPSCDAVHQCTDPALMCRAGLCVPSVCGEDPIEACAPSCAPEWQNTDVGAVGLAGSASCSEGELAITSSGSDVWGTADEMHFVYQALSGDGWIEARVVSNAAAVDWSKTGVMIRESLAADAAHAHMLVSKAATNPVKFDRRLSSGAPTSGLDGALVSPPHWVRLARRGAEFSGYESPDGIVWTKLGTHTIAMTADVLIGLSAHSHDNAVLATAVFDNVTVDLAAVPECFVDADCQGGASCDGASCSVSTPTALRAAVNPVGYSRDINLDRIDQTVRITQNDQVQTFLSAASMPWTRILVDDGVVLAVRTTLLPAEGVKIYCPNGSFTIDGRGRDNFNVIVLENPHIYMANFVLQVPVGDTSQSNNPYVGISIRKPTADLIYLQSFTVDAPGNNGAQDAAEAFHIWNMTGASGRLTVDQYEFVTNPSPGSKGLLIGGGDSSTVRVTMVHGICRSYQRGPLVGAGAFVDYFNNIVPTQERWSAVNAREGAGVRVRASFFHPRTNSSWGSELKVEDSSSSITLGPEQNVAYAGVTLESMGPEALTPPYPNPPTWDEATVSARAGAGTIVLPE